MTNHLPFRRRVFNCVIWHAFICVVSLYAVCCTEEKPQGKYPVIDVANDVVSNNYQRLYCSDFFSSIELIPLETKKESILSTRHEWVILNDSLIFVRNSNNVIYVFDRSGKFLNQIGNIGRGPGEYPMLTDFFLNTDKPTVFLTDTRFILEYEYNGKFIRSYRKPFLGDAPIAECFYVSDNLFVGKICYNGKNEHNYCLFDHDGNIVKYFPNFIFYDKVGNYSSSLERALKPIRVYDHIYLKDNLNDTLYVLSNMKMMPAYIFNLGKYSIPKNHYSTMNFNPFESIMVLNIMATQKFIFYVMNIPNKFPRPKSPPRYVRTLNTTVSTESTVYGIFNIEQNTNILLDTDLHQRKGFVNDINGGLPFFSLYYAGNRELVTVWQSDDMKEALTEDYFSKQTIKDRQAHQKLKEVLKNLDEEDNPVVVIAKLK